MKCQGCGNPFCRAGKLYQALIMWRFYGLLVLLFVPAMGFGSFMPIPWALGATTLYVLALSQMLTAIGKKLFASMARADMIRATDDLIAEAKKEPPR